MKRIRYLSTVLALTGVCAVLGANAAGPQLTGLDPALWREPKANRLPEARAAEQALVEALRCEDAAAVAQATAAWRAALGGDAGMPEVRPDYQGVPQTGEPRMAELLRLWQYDCARRAGSDPWDVAQNALNAGRFPARLRDSVRMAEAYLITAGLVDPTEGEAWRTRALNGLRYVQSCQSRRGVFGYPFDPKRQDRLGRMAAAMVARGRERGFVMTEGNWIVEDAGDGGLQFDNGICGLAMLRGYALTGETAFLTSAKRAGEWALGQAMVPNWNYNAFSGRLLARLYIVTGEGRFLDGAKRKFQLGVIPGQDETGRWFDPHNVRTQYHAILATALADYVDALTAADDPATSSAKLALEKALDNLAIQTCRFGASNPHEMLPLEAFWRGFAVCGPRPAWREAVCIYLNILTPELVDRFRNDLGHLPETLPMGLTTLD